MYELPIIIIICSKLAIKIKKNCSGHFHFFHQSKSIKMLISLLKLDILTREFIGIDLFFETATGGTYYFKFGHV